MVVVEVDPKDSDRHDCGVDVLGGGEEGGVVVGVHGPWVCTREEGVNESPMMELVITAIVELEDVE